VRARSLLPLLFVVYCVEVGTALVVWPWSPSWDRVCLMIPWEAVRIVAVDHFFRGLLAGFGVLHLVWGAHDLDLWLARRRRADSQG
jgi:hypothetical protein